MTITVSSPAFEAGATIPKKHTGEGEDTSPPLHFEGVPEEAKELALICHDPDAPRESGWVHWVVYKLPANTTALAEGASGGWITGENDWGKAEYGGPMPPPGHGVHHYHFKLYALDVTLPPEPGLTMKQLLAKIEGHVIAQGELVGTYERKKK